MGNHSKQSEVLQAYCEKVKGILNVILDKKGNKNKGTGYFIVEHVENALELIQYEGKKIV